MPYIPPRHDGAFDRLVSDLKALDARRSRDRLTAQRHQQAAYRHQRHTESAALAKAITAAPPVDFSAIQRDQARLQQRIAADQAATTRRQCAATLAQLDQAAKAGRLTGVQGAALDRLRWQFGALTRPTPPRAA